MKKSVNINLGGIVFHIDEDAYERLHEYRAGLERKFGNTAESKEIINDIESRMAELLQERLSSKKQSVDIADIEYVIAVMGGPEEVAQEAEYSTINQGNTTKRWYQRKLYRDPDNAVIGGVCGGLGSFFGIDPVILRILFLVVLALFSGYQPGAFESRNDYSSKLVPGNLRLSNELSDIPEFEGFDKTLMRFMKRWNIVGASVAVAHDGNLVYAKGFGFADSISRQPVQPYSRFRIASISKLVTAVAVMKLQEEGKLSVHDKVFGPEGILNDPYYSNPKDRRVYDITVLHLLSHQGGWTTRYGDQMFMPFVVASSLGIPVPVDTKTIVRFALNKNLHYTPGRGRSYSNLGYAILGLVIEKASGMTYQEYCRKHILEPCGIYDMNLASNLRTERQPYEVTYYEPPDAILKPSVYGTGEMVPASYGGNDIESLGAAGAWIATAPDLVKLVLHIDGVDNPEDIISPESVRFMVDTGNGFAPLGWKATVQGGLWWRTGSFPGSAGMIKRQPDGVIWVFLMNTSTWNGPEITAELSMFMSRALAQVKKWPGRNLFSMSIEAPLSEYIDFMK